MKKLKVTVYKGLLCLLCMILMVNSGAMSVMAAPGNPFGEVETQKVFLDHYKLTDDKIVPGSEFTLTLFFQNTGNQDAKQVIVDVLYSKGIMPAYGTVSQAVVDIPAGETVEVELPYVAQEKIETPVLDFQVTIREKELQNATLLRTPVGSSSPFAVITTFVPAAAKTEDQVNCSMTFKYLGLEAVDQITARMDVDGKTVNTMEIGNLPKDTTKTQSLSATFPDEGKYVVEMYLDYEDAAGEKQTILAGVNVIEVQEADEKPAVPNNGDMEKQQNASHAGSRQLNNLQILLISGALIAVIVLIMVFLIRRKK